MPEFTQDDMAAVLKLLGPYMAQFRQLQTEANRVNQVMRSITDAYLAGKGMTGKLALDPASGTLRYEPETPLVLPLEA